MRKNLNKWSFWLLLLSHCFLTACKEQPATASATEHYVCPMHPEVQSKEPGSCPKCHMDLVLMSMQPIEPTFLADNQILSRQKTVKLDSNHASNNIQAVGYIDVDLNRNISVAARYGGRIEKLWVKYNLQYVKKGEKILEIYSPELSSYQEEHLFLIKSAADKSLLEKSREKLALLGINPTQIEQLEKTGVVTKVLAVYSPANGFLFFDGFNRTKTETANKSSSMGSMAMKKMAMPNQSEQSFASSEGQIQEGMYINKGQNLFSVNDLQSVWAIVSIPNEHYASIQENQLLKISSELMPNKIIPAKIALIEKIFEDKNQRFARARIPLSNPNYQFKINSLLRAEIPLTETASFQIPSSAVYRTGLSSVVWVKTGTSESGAGIFELRKVVAGDNINGMTSIISGLSKQEEVALHAGLMSDSETFINGN